MRYALIALLVVPCLSAAAQDDARIDRLIRQLGSEDFAAQGAAAKELEKIGLPAIAALERAKAEGGQTGEWAARILARLVDVEAAELRRLIESLGADDFEVQGKAAKQLAEIGDRAMGALRLAKASDNAQIRDWAGRIIAKIEGEAPAPTLPGRELEPQVRDACVWLARHQYVAGSWAPAGYLGLCNRKEGFRDGGRCTGHGVEEAEVGVTGLALAALVGAGFGVHAQDEYDGVAVGESVRRAVRWLVRGQDKEGCLANRAVQKYIYHHAIATMALADAARTAADGKVFAESDVVAMKNALEKAAHFLVQAQNPGAGWRYSYKCGDNDTSVTSWCVQALVASKRAGVKVPEKSFTDAVAWFESVTEDAYGRVGYTHKGTGKVFVPGQNESYLHHETLTAAAAACRILIDPKAALIKEAVQAKAIITRDLPRWAKDEQDFCYWYYGTLFLKLDEGKVAKEWDAAVRKALGDSQGREAGTCARGSWESVGRWCHEGGRVYAVAMNALTLEVLQGLRKVEGK